MNDENDKLKCMDINVNIAGTESVPKTIMGLVEKLLGPGTEQSGFFIQDIVKCVEWTFWENISRMTGYTKEMPNMKNNNLYNPRMFFSILNNAGWTDDERLQKMWAGLLASSRSLDGKDDSNLIFVNILSQLTSSEVKILDYVCSNTKKSLTVDGLINATPIEISIENLLEMFEIKDIHRLDLELDHLKSLDLTGRASQFMAVEGPEAIKRDSIRITPTGLALNLFIRCKGSLQSPVDFFEYETR